MSPLRLAVPLTVAALAAASLLLPFAPLYDVWAWLVWGHEITGLDLDTGAGEGDDLQILFSSAERLNIAKPPYGLTINPFEVFIAEVKSRPGR